MRKWCQGRLFAALLPIVLVAFPAFAQTKFPSKPVTIVVPYPPGGSNDTFARELGKRLGDAWKVPVIIDNRPGAGGNIGAAVVSRAAPDGYTLCLLSSSFTTNAAIQPNLPFDPVAGFSPVAMVAKGPMLLTVSNHVPARTTLELFDLARRDPGKLNFGSSGQGSTNHFATELLMDAAQIKMTHVPYKGMSPAVTDVIGGHVDVLIASAPSIYQQVKAGKVRGLGVTSKGPSAVVPDLAPVAQMGAPGLQLRAVVGHPRAAAHAARDRRAGERRREPDPRHAGDEGSVPARGRRAGDDVARAVRRDHQKRDRGLEESGEGLEHQGGIAVEIAC